MNEFERAIPAIETNPWPSKKPKYVWISIFKSFAKESPKGLACLKVTLESNGEEKVICNTFDVEDEMISQSTSLVSIFRHHNDEIDQLRAELAEKDKEIARLQFNDKVYKFKIGITDQ